MRPLKLVLLLLLLLLLLLRPVRALHGQPAVLLRCRCLQAKG
jgi:hypothetical protein